MIAPLILVPAAIAAGIGTSKVLEEGLKMPGVVKEEEPNFVDKAAQTIGIQAKPDTRDPWQKLQDAAGAAGEWASGVLDGAKSKTGVATSVLDPQNRLAWTKDPTPEQLADYNKVKDTPQYKKTVDSLGLLKNVPGSDTIKGTGVHHIAMIVHNHTADLKELPGQAVAGLGEFGNQIVKSAPTVWSNIAKSFGETVQKTQESWQKDGFAGVASSLANSFGQGISGTVGFIAGGVDFNKIKGNILEDRLALIEKDLSTQGFTKGFIDPLIAIARTEAANEAELKNYQKPEQKVAIVEVKEKEPEKVADSGATKDDGAKKLAEVAAKAKNDIPSGNMPVADATTPQVQKSEQVPAINQPANQR